MEFSITGYSTALFATWYFIEELGILFDAGDGLSAGLLHKAGKVKQAFISHADRDQLTGLLQFNQLNAREGLPVVYYPLHCGSFPPLEQFSKNFDPHVSGTVWQPIETGACVAVQNDIFVEAIRNEHVQAAPGIAKSLGYKICKTKTKLKAEFTALPQHTIRELIAERGKEQLLNTITTNIISYSGDTPVDDYDKWNNTEILIHEATFLDDAAEGKVNLHGNRHSTLDEVMRMVAAINIKQLILGHFSSRYSAREITESVRAKCRQYHISVPVYCVLPGQLHRDILGQEPVN
jgi:ribonuclease Z